MTLRKYRQADWEEPLVFELGHKGRIGFLPPKVEPEIINTVDEVEKLIPSGILRVKPPLYQKFLR